MEEKYNDFFKSIHDRVKNSDVYKCISNGIKLLEMEDNNKYYIPEIEEFHVGFEFQLDPYEINEWKEKIITDRDAYQFKLFKKFCKKENVRVKYLDKEDIESLGWKGYKDMFVFEGEISFSLEITGVNHYLISQYKKAPENIGVSIFWGRVKNKSELKKLMQQLNIKK